jgi:hypothetical protein
MKTLIAVTASLSHATSSSTTALSVKASVSMLPARSPKPLAEYDRTYINEANTTVSPPLHFTIKIEATRLATEQKIDGLGVSNDREDPFT